MTAPWGRSVAITGHTKGIGKALFDREDAGLFDVAGYSASLGYDISNGTDRQRIIAETQTCDVFVNNAFDWDNMFAQTEMLYDIFDDWREKDRLIINIGSNTTDGIKPFAHKYAAAKAALEKASEQLSNLGRCRVSLVRFGLVATQRVLDISQFSGQPMLQPQEAAELINEIIDSPRYIRSITLTPHI